MTTRHDDAHDPRGPGAPWPTDEEVRRQRQRLGLQVQAAKRFGVRGAVEIARARWAEWAVTDDEGGS